MFREGESRQLRLLSDGSVAGRGAEDALSPWEKSER